MTDPFLWHEAMDRIHVLTDQWTRAVEDHPVINSDPVLMNLAAIASGAMVTLYSAVVNRAPHMRAP